MGSLRDPNSPWRTFENYLLEYQPAIGFPHFGWQSRNESLEVQSVALFDAMITAFHAQVWEFMFPYETRWDDQVCTEPDASVSFCRLLLLFRTLFVWFACALHTLTVGSLGTGP
jgi:hypothetical protein